MRNEVNLDYFPFCGIILIIIKKKYYLNQDKHAFKEK